MKKFTVQINEAQEKALLTNMISIQDWLENTIHEKARRIIDNIITRNTDKQPKKMSAEEKQNLIMKMKLVTGAEKNAELNKALGI